MTDVQLLNYIAIPVGIFLARVVDVSLGTMKVIYVTQGNRWIAAGLGFFETLVWLVAISQVMKNLTTWHCYVAWATGYSAGIFVGITLVKMIQSRRKHMAQPENIFMPNMMDQK